MTFTFPNKTLLTSLINAAIYIHSYWHKHTKREDIFSTLSLKPKSLKFIVVEKYQTATLPHSKTPRIKQHLLNGNEDPEKLLQKVRHQQADFSSRWPRQTKAEVNIIFSLPAWGQPITRVWRVHRDGPGSSPGRTEEWGTWALCKVTTSLAAAEQGCSVSLPHLSLPRRWKSSLVLPSPDWRDSNETEGWISCLLSPMVFPVALGQGEQWECVHSRCSEGAQIQPCGCCEQLRLLFSSRS